MSTLDVTNLKSKTANAPVQFLDKDNVEVGTLCRAWVNFNGTGTVAIRASFNVSSITDNGVGDYTVNFTTDMDDANYAICGSTKDAGNAAHGLISYRGNPTTTSVRISTTKDGGAADNDWVSVAIFR